MYCESLEKLHEVTTAFTKFLEPNESFREGIRTSLKNLYNFTKSQEIKTARSNALRELITQNFDVEQIWQQIELQNDSVMAPLLTAVSEFLVDKSGVSFGNRDSENQNVEKNSERSNSDYEDEMGESSDEDVNLEDVESSDDHERVENATHTNLKSSVVDDNFFKLAEMEKFLEAEERKLDDPDSGNNSDDDTESEESVDLFETPISGDDDDEDKMKMVKYKDFFGKKSDPQQELKSDADKSEHLPSSFELRQSRLDRKIAEFEERAVEDKSWQLKGEITAENRPQNSLLEEIVEFDLTTRPAPIMTEQSTMQLEDIIKQRIKERVFDSVERKVKPVDMPYEYKKRLVLDQEKSKESLAQIYEKEFLEQQSAFDKDKEQEEREPQLHQEINQMMRNLFVKLDSLSNFHFTPKLATTELKVVSNLPAVCLEEVAPVATSDAALLAPEEIKAKSKGVTVGKNERTVTDKKRERRRKKLKQKIHAKEKQKKDISKKGAIYSEKKDTQKAKKRKIGKVDASDGSEGVKSSKAFFTQLQEQVQSHIKRKSVGQQRKVDAKASSAKRLKL